MSEPQIRAQLSRMGLTVAAAERLLGVSERAMRRYARGERYVPPPVLRLLSVAEQVPGVRAWLEQTVEVPRATETACRFCGDGPCDNRCY